MLIFKLGRLSSFGKTHYRQGLEYADQILAEG